MSDISNKPLTGGIPIQDLITAPLAAAALSQSQLSDVTTKFIQEVGLKSTEAGNKEPVYIEFSYSSQVTDDNNEPTGETATRVLKIPLLTVINIPNLKIDKVTVDFHIDVSSQQSTNHNTNTSSNSKYAWSEYQMVGTISHHQNAETSASYSVHVEASDKGPSQGLKRVLGILESLVDDNQSQVVTEPEPEP